MIFCFIVLWVLDFRNGFFVEFELIIKLLNRRVITKDEVLER